MIVTRAGFHGSIGGGALEWKAMAEAQRLLDKVADNGASRRESRHVLGPDLGQCCGGTVTLTTQAFNAESLTFLPDTHADDRSTVLLFGAGHVGRAIVMAAAPLPLKVLWFDERPGAFPSYIPGNVDVIAPGRMSVEIAAAPAGSLAFVMTHSHGLDLEIVDACLRNQSIARTGLIGSATKRARFVSRLKAAGITPEQLARLICPIGIGGLGGKEPGVIAASTVAQILVLDQALREGKSLERHAKLSS
jgi:xanthine dehydrogenase accessory factor